MMIDDAGSGHRDINPPAYHGRRVYDAVALSLSHGILVPVEIADVFEADGIRIIAKDAGGRRLDTAPREYCAVRENGKVLPDITPAIGIDVMRLHATLHVNMVIAPEVRIGRGKCMMMLHTEYSSRNAGTAKPGIELLWVVELLKTVLGGRHGGDVIAN